MLRKLKFLFFTLFILVALPGISQEEDDLLEKLELDRKRQTEAAVKLDESRQKFQDTSFNAVEELKKLGHSQLTAASLLDEKVVGILQRVFKENHLRDLSHQEVRGLIFDKVRGRRIENYLARNPKMVDGMVDILRDEKAMPGLLGIFLRRDDLKLYIYIWLGLAVVGYLIKRFWFPKKWQRLFFTRFLLSLSIAALSLGIFYKMFRTELDPTLVIIHKHWKS